MRNGLPSPLSGIRSPFGLRDGVSAYAVAGFEPELVFDFENEVYRTNGSTSTFDDAMTFSRSGNATMVDSDGLLKWAPHNLALNSASPATQSITVVSGADYTVECTGVSIALSGAGTGTVTEGNPVEITASTTTLTLTVTGATGTMWAYRSDLGGMVDNPDTGNSYVPTTSSAVYLPRRGHHVYNGTSWVNEGLLVESEARTNLLTYSSEFDNAAWTKINSVTIDDNVVIAPDGTLTGDKLVESTSTGSQLVLQSFTSLSGTTYSASVFVRKADRGFALVYLANGFPDSGISINLTTGEVTTAIGSPINPASEDFGNGWFRVSFSETADVTTPGASLNVYASVDGVWANRQYAGDGTSGVYIYGAQFEEASTPSSYIPTSGSTVTRSADSITVPSAKMPWPTPNVIGPELVTNGTFDTDTDWTKNGNWAISGGVAVCGAGTGSSQGLVQSGVFASGKVYQYSITVSGVTGSEYLRFKMGEVGDTFLATGSGTYTGFLAGRPLTSIDIRPNKTTTTSNITVDNISVREIDPLAVSIQMQGRQTGDSYTMSRWYDDANNYITQESGTNDYTFEQADGGTVDSVTGGSFTSGILQPFNFASTHASTFVAAAVNGTALTDDTTPTALADLSSTDMTIGHDFNGTIKLARIWAANITEAGREEASS